MKFLPQILVFSLILVCLGCNTKDSGNIKIGSYIVQNSTERKNIEFKYLIVHSFGQEGHIPIIESFKALKADSMGNIYLLDFKKGMVLKFSNNLKYIRSVGRKGEGPGEFNYAQCLTLDSKNNIYVADSSRKISIFNSDGKYIQTIKTDFHVRNMNINKHTGILTVGYKKYIHKDDQKHTYDRKTLYCLGDLNLKNKSISDFYQKEQFIFDRIARNQDGIVIQIPHFVLFTDNLHELFVCCGDEYEIIVFDRNRNIIRKISKKFKFNGINQKELDLVDQIFKQYSYLKNKFYKLTKYYPVMNSITVDENNQLWVELYIPNKFRKSSFQTKYDVFSKEGKYIHTAIIKEKILSPLIFKNDFVYCLLENKQGNYLLSKLKFLE
jgi:hypothetical protein